MRHLFSREYLSKYKSTFLLAYPIIISQLGHVMVQLADSLMVGQTGVVPLAACSLASAVFSLFLVFGIGYSFGITPLVAQENGKKNYAACANLLEHGMFSNFLIGIVLFLCILGISFALPYLGQDPIVIAQAQPFLITIGFSLIPLIFFLVLKQFAEAISLTKKAMYISIAANVLNIILNYILIFGKFGFPAYGLLGAGYANLISRIFMAVAMIFYFYKSSDFEKFRKALHWRNIEFPILKRLSAIGLPISLQFVFEVGAFTCAAIIIGSMGAVPLASHQIAISIATVTYMAAGGIGNAATIQIGNELGAGNYKGIRTAGISSFALTIMFMGAMGIIFIIFNNYLPHFYVKELPVIHLASKLIIVAALFQLSDGIQVIALGALRGLSDVKIPSLIAFVSYWLIAIPLGILLGVYFKMGVIGVWIGLLFGLSASALMLFRRFNSISKKLIIQHENSI